jgi:hypothetical protein
MAPVLSWGRPLGVAKRRAHGPSALMGASPRDACSLGDASHDLYGELPGGSGNFLLTLRHSGSHIKKLFPDARPVPSLRDPGRDTVRCHAISGLLAGPAARLGRAQRAFKRPRHDHFRRSTKMVVAVGECLRTR